MARSDEHKNVDKRTCFVRNVPYGFDTDKLTELFSAGGPVKHAFIVGEAKGQKTESRAEDAVKHPHKGYGFVSFALAEHAAQAAAELNGRVVDGRALQV
jgi:nucleolar protein 4